MSKSELLQWIENMTEEQATDLLCKLQTKEYTNGLEDETQIREETIRNLNRFLADLSGSLSAVLFDLSKEAEKKNDLIMANRLNFAMKKIKESWEEYKSKSKKP